MGKVPIFLFVGDLGKHIWVVLSGCGVICISVLNRMGIPTRKGIQGLVKYPTNFCTLELCARAGELLKRVGFVHYQTSMKTESTYYRWPDRVYLIRVASHGGRQSRSMWPGARKHVIAKITFRGTHLDPKGMMNISDEKVENIVAMAIGRYFLKSAEYQTEDV